MAFRVARKVASWTGVIVFVLAIGLVVGSLLPKGLNPWSKSEPVITSTTIKNSFADIAELATEEYNFTGVGKFSDDGYKLLGLRVPFTGKSFLVTFSGRVTGGLKNLEAVDPRIDSAKRVVTLVVPRADVLDAKVDPASLEQYDQTFNPINQVSVQDIADFLATETEKAKKTAVDGGLLVRADKRLAELLTAQTQAVLSGVSTPEAPWTVEVKHPEDVAEKAQSMPSQAPASGAPSDQGSGSASTSVSTTHDAGSAPTSDGPATHDGASQPASPEATTQEPNEATN
ncbi:hypothetical protein J2S49_001102 [Arcanobacterium wilhelmae]|uniref:DUF4230 domain-containing protein n=1 Tax=Arcanobacterium wilhelmae TaxID=1803177 RepID=A0ABT9NBF0_9ACTO|nr:DUF4230 domain-containing protein [Arcanobacterium wilhelmae]MDP9801026.1 hypothetical protein [Arcanobacterium wilhelmae]WFN90385.1 DUF4230 domain-containing protein [Arcanobacterium wilhelmae]